MGARNPGQLRLNFGTAILIDSEYLRVIFESPKNTSPKRRHLASKSKMMMSKLFWLYSTRLWVELRFQAVSRSNFNSTSLFF